MHDAGSSAANFAAAGTQFESHGETTAGVTGVGNQAYSGDVGTFGTLVARKRQRRVLITAAAPLNAERTLMLQILGEF